MPKLIEMRPPRIALVLLLISMGIWHLSPPNTLLHIPFRLIGWIFIVAGFVVMMWAWLQFKEVKTAICPTGISSVLVKKGIFRLTRNPMYLGMLLMLIGASFLMGSLSSSLAFIVFFLIMDKVFIPFEEKKLEGHFGPEYLKYREITNRWL